MSVNILLHIMQAIGIIVIVYGIWLEIDMFMFEWRNK